MPQTQNISMIYNVPLVSNRREDNTWCFQACLKMIFGYYEPDTVYSWETLAQISGKERGYYTWPMATWSNLNSLGYTWEAIELFDYHQFAQDPEAYMLEIWGEEVTQDQMNHLNKEYEVNMAKNVIQGNSIIKRVPTLDDIRQYIDTGYLVMPVVNSRILRKVEGIASHVVVITGYTADGFIYNDPGLRDPMIDGCIAAMGLYVSIEDFLRAWQFPSVQAASITAIKKI